MNNQQQRDQWLAQIRQNPSDWQTMLIFADWLEESGDLLAAEQWRFISVLIGPWQGWTIGGITSFARFWPDTDARPLSALKSYEMDFAAENNIRCMPTYPLTIEDVEAYLQASR